MSYTGFTSAKSLDADFGSTNTYPISMFCWIKVPAAAWATTTGKYILHFNDSAFGTGSVANSIWTVIVAGSADLARAQTQGDSAGNLSTASVGGGDWSDGDLDNIWIPFVGVHGDTGDSAEVIINGISGGKSSSEKANTDAFRYLRVGANTQAGFNEADDGVLIAEVAIFDKLLSAAEISALKTSDQTGPPPNTVASSNCIAYWSLNSEQSSHSDESGNGGPSLTERGFSADGYSSDHPTIVSSTINTVTINTGQKITVTDGSPIQ